MRSPEVDRCYRVFGHSLSTAHRFSTPLEVGEGPADLSFRIVEHPPADVEAAGVATYDRQLPLARKARLQVIHSPELDIVRRTDAVEFYLQEDRIEARLLDRGRMFLLEIGFFGMALPLWVQRRGWLVLHGSAVRIGDRAVGFLASRQGGKSSLAAAAMEAGFPLLSDDLLAVEPLPDGLWRAHGSFPQQRFWPQDAARIVGSIAGLERSHPSIEKLRVPVGTGLLGHYDGAGVPLSALYLPARDPALDRVEIGPLPLGDSVMNLLRESSFPAIAEAAGLQASRFDLVSRMALEVPVRDLRYPPGFEHLPEVVASLVRDLNDL